MSIEIKYRVNLEAVKSGIFKSVCVRALARVCVCVTEGRDTQFNQILDFFLGKIIPSFSGKWLFF